MLYLSHYDNSPTYSDLKDHRQGEHSLLSKDEQQKVLQYQWNYEGKSISKLQIVIVKKQMGIMTYKQYLCEQPLAVATVSMVTLLSARIMSSTLCKVAGVAISTG